MFWATAVLTVGWLLALFVPRPMARLFTTDDTLISLAATGILINMLMFPFIGFQAVIANFFQCIGRVQISIFLSLSRQLLFLLPLIIILPFFWGLNGVWAALPASDLIAAVVAAAVMWRTMREFRTK